MKVIKEGKWHLPWTTELGCPTCEATLMVEEADVNAPDYCASDAFDAKCAICGHNVPIDKKLLPLRITEKLNKKRKYYSSSWD